MALTVENGSGVTGAQTYISETDFETYASDRGYTVTGTSSELLLQAMLYVDSLSFKGTRASDTQRLKWPRYGVYIDGVSISSSAIPQQLKDLECEVALAIDSGYDPLGRIDRAVKREKVDAIEVEYQDNAVPFALHPKIRALQSELTRVRSGGMTIELWRA